VIVQKSIKDLKKKLHWIAWNCNFLYIYDSLDCICTSCVS